MKRHILSLMIGIFMSAIDNFLIGSPVAGPIADELALPVLPEGMKDPAQRADYILLHFWDGMDFNDTLRSRDREFMEQNLVNFFSVMPHASSDGRRLAVESLMKKTSADDDARKLVMELSEHYLYEPGSPMRDEEMFMPFLIEAVEAEYIPDSEKIRLKYLLEEVKRNRVGTEASDFSMKLRDGTTVGMRDLALGKVTVLMFYDPECGHCAETVSAIDDDKALVGLIDEGAINMLAVYPFGEEDVWNEQSMVKLPSYWTDAFSDLSESDLYSFPEMPVIYLLDREGRVLLKDTTVERLLQVVAEL